MSEKFEETKNAGEFDMHPYIRRMRNKAINANQQSEDEISKTVQKMVQDDGPGDAGEVGLEIRRMFLPKPPKKPKSSPHRRNRR
jgi:hypothetical protein